MSPGIWRNVVRPKAWADDERHCLRPKDAKPGDDDDGNWKAWAVVMDAKGRNFVHVDKVSVAIIN